MNPTLLLILCSVIGVLMVEVGAISKRAKKDAKFDVMYYLKQNAWVIVWNLLGVVALLLCNPIILYFEQWLLTKAGLDLTWMNYAIAPTGIFIGYGGGRAVRILLNKGASKIGLEDAFVEVATEVTQDAVKTTTTMVTPTPPTEPKP